MDDSGVGFMIVIYLALAVFYIYCLWRIFEKAGEPGWGAIIPIYNAYLLVKIAGKPGWWVLLYFVPLVNVVIAILVCIGVAENFSKSAAFGLGLFFLSFIFYPILALGSAQYKR